jgi:hypothetical protein
MFREPPLGSSTWGRKYLLWHAREEKNCYLEDATISQSFEDAVQTVAMRDPRRVLARLPWW